MDEDQILQSIIADPQLTDPSIDVSQLRQTTPTRTELLADVPEFSGLKFDPTQRSYIEDLYALYGGGAPMLPEPVVDTPVVDTTPMVDTSAMGQPAGDSVLDSTPTNTLEQDRLVDQGIGVQLEPGAPVVAPGEIPVTQEEIDAFNAPATLDSTSTAEDILQDLSNQQAMLNPTGGNIMDEVALTGGVPDTNITAPSGDVFAAGDPLAAEKIDFQTPEQQEGFVQNVLGRAGQTVDNALNELSKIPGAVADFTNQTIDIFGKKLNVGKTLAAAAVNKVVGAPISLVFELLPKESLENTTTRSIVDELKAEKNYGFNIQSGNLNQDPFGRNPVSAFGDYEQTLKDDILGVNQTGFQTAEMREAKKEFAQDYFDKKAEKAGGVVTEPGTVVGPGEMPVTQEEIDAFNAPPPGINLVDEVSLTGGDNTPSGPPEGPGITADDAFGGDGPSNVGGPPSGPGITADDAFGGDGPSNAGGPPSGPGEASADAGFEDSGSSGSVSTGGPPSQGGSSGGPPSQGGGGGSSGGGGKIVCTMMNESYGFGSFRNKIWLRHSKNLAPEYQIGYHKIFLPLVKLSKTNKVLKKILEHIAVHRTIDIRQESRGKVHLLGRMYRKILEPICYWVGKYAKR